MEKFEETKYRKKKPSDKSKLEKRSDHKHIYEDCLIRNHFIFSWCEKESVSIHFGERCIICGKTHTCYLPSIARDTVTGQRYYRAWTAEEMLEKYPNLPIIDIVI